MERWQFVAVSLVVGYALALTFLCRVEFGYDHRIEFVQTAILSLFIVLLAVICGYIGARIERGEFSS